MSIIEEIFVKQIEAARNEMAYEQWYNHICNKMIEVRKQLCAQGEFVKQLLDQYDLLCLDLHSKTEELMYAKGFKDGMKCKDELVSILVSDDK